MAHQIDQVHPADTTAFGANRPYRGLEWRSTRSPEYHIYLFNVSPRTFDPATATGFAAGKLGPRGILVPGVAENDPLIPGTENRYRYITSFPQPVMLAKPNLESNEIEHVEMDVRRYVIDLINPDNLTLSLDTQIPADQVYSVGNDYSRKGIFFDYENPPTKEMAMRAVSRMETYYKGLLDTAATLELTDKARLSQELSSNPDYSFAANYYGKDVTWNRKQTRPIECPNCGEHKPSGRKFHTTSFGSLCVEPTIDAWRNIFQSGIRTLDQIPQNFRVVLQDEMKPKKEPAKTDQIAEQLAAGK